MGDKYLTNDLLSITGMTRDTLRHYEQKGLINPSKDMFNNYRQFQFADIYRLLTIDFYRKRGFTINELRHLQDNFQDLDFSMLVQQKQDEMKKKIAEYSEILDRLNKLEAFRKRVTTDGSELNLERLPLYEIVGTFSEFDAFEEYSQVLAHCAKKDDILSSIIRCLEFDETGITDSRMLIVKEVMGNRMQEEKEYLNLPKCVNTIVTENLDEEDNEEIAQQMFEKTLGWAREKNLIPLGQAYVITQMVTYQKQKEQAVLEIFVPVK